MREINLMVRQGSREYESAGEAIAAARSGRLFEQVLLHRPRILEVSWSDTDFCVLAEGPLQFVVEGCADSTKCELRRDTVERPSDVEPITLRFRIRYGAPDVVDAWNPAELPGMLRQRRLLGFFGNAPHIFMYASSLLPIIFMPLRNDDDGLPLFHWAFAR